MQLTLPDNTRVIDLIALATATGKRLRACPTGTRPAHEDLPDGIHRLATRRQPAGVLAGQQRPTGKDATR